MRTCVCVCVCKLFRLCKRICCAHPKVCNEKFAATAPLPTTEICMGQPKKVVERAINTAHSTRNTHSHTHTLTHTSSQINTLPHTNYLQLPHKVFTHNRLEVRHCPRSSFKYIYRIIYVYSMHISISISLCHIWGSIFSIACQSMLAKRILSILPYINLHLSPLSHCVLSLCVCACARVYSVCAAHERIAGSWAVNDCSALLSSAFYCAFLSIELRHYLINSTFSYFCLKYQTIHAHAYAIYRVYWIIWSTVQWQLVGYEMVFN